MKNMFSIIKQQNKECCPLERICLKEYMIYEVKVTTVSNFKSYHGTCEEGYENETELFKLIWQLKDKSNNYKIRSKIFTCTTPYKCDAKGYYTAKRKLSLNVSMSFYFTWFVKIAIPFLKTYLRRITRLLFIIEILSHLL